MNSLHFSPRRNWMNDPNGLLFHGGRYHLYFQYNPLGVGHGNLSWGHASSKDLVVWEEHPVAIRFDDDEEIFSGSIVVDAENTTGFGSVESPALVACYTSESKHAAHQAQSLAYSLDGGLSWTKHAGNPVLDRRSADFRDPKIIRWDGGPEGAEGSYWVMVAVEAKQQEVVLYRSDDLLSWTYLSSFGPSGAVGGVWECPDLFPLRLEGTDEVRWVLLVSLWPGGIAGGSGTQYFVGEFDGRTFTPDVHREPVEVSDEAGLAGLDWFDYGRDCYAGVTFAGLPDDQRTLIAWMGNWEYAKQMPVDAEAPRRGSMTLARRLSLTTVDGRPRLRQSPVGPALAQSCHAEDVVVTEPEGFSTPVPSRGRIDLAIALQEAEGVSLRLEGDDGHAVVIGYDRATAELSCDRREAAVGYPEGFASVQRMPLETTPTLELTLWLDEESIEIFAAGGTRVLTDLIGPLRSPDLRVTGIDGAVSLVRLSTRAACDGEGERGAETARTAETMLR